MQHITKKKQKTNHKQMPSSFKNVELFSYRNYKFKQINRRYHWVLEIFSIMLAIFFISYLFFNSFLLSILCTGLTIFLKSFVISHSNTKNQKILESEFKLFIMTIASILNIGRSLESSILLAIEEIKKEGTMVFLIDDFEEMIIQLEANCNSSEIFEMLAKKYSIETMSNFCQIIILAKKQGSSMQKVINNTAQMIEEKIEVEKELEVVTAQKKFELLIMLLFVPMMIMYLRGVSTNFSETMYQTFQGKIAMFACLLIYGISGYIGSKIIDIRI